MKKRKNPAIDLETILPLVIGVWRRMHKVSGPPDVLQTREFRRVVEGVKTLHEGLENKDLIGKNYFSDPELLGSYLLYQWIVHYQQAMSVLNELPNSPRRVLDIGSGPAPFAFAALRHGASEVYATDRNVNALELGSTVCGRYGLPVSIRQWDCLKQPLPISGTFDLIMLGHCLEEMFPANQKNWKDQQYQFIRYLLDKLNPQGFLLIVDGSYIESNRRILELRDALVQAGVPVQAPCIWQGECPALKAKDSPCYAQREFEKPHLIKEIQRAVNINLGSLKMSYIIFRSPKAQWPVVANKGLYRIISPPVESYQGKRYYLCGSEGKKSLGSHLSEHPVESRAFEYLRRGELISVQEALERPSTLDIIKGTTVSVEAACGKPLEEKLEGHGEKS